MSSNRPPATTRRVETAVAVVFTQLTLGGAERQTVELLRRLRGTEWQPSLVVCLSRDIEPYGAAIESLGYELRLLSRTANFEVGRIVQLRRLLRRHRIAVVHAVGLLASAYAWLATRATTIQVLPSMRGGAVRTHPLRNALYRLMLRRSPYVLVNSNQAATYLTKTFATPANRIAVVPNGIDVSAVIDNARSGGFRQPLTRDSTKVIGFVGKDAPVKNLPLWIAIFTHLLAEHSGVCGVVVGQNLGEHARQKFAPNIAPGQLQFLGPRHDVPALLREMDVLLLTSDSEGCPNVVLEAIAVGTPVVARAVGDVPHILRGGGAGTVIDDSRPEPYVTAIHDWLRRGRSTEAQYQRGLANLEKAYSMTAMVRGTTDLWKRLSGSTSATD